jgi:hypothetical protein
MKTRFSPFARLLSLGLLLGMVCGHAAAAGARQTAPINVATYNLRYNHVEDGPNAWPARKDMVRR